ncbi:hypothetical protein C8039_07010 [Halogeometricum sp. wsp3]|nr:hypothetical protein C8039_07010 [Halogeometricum sp. wsp3]
MTHLGLSAGRCCKRPTETCRIERCDRTDSLFETACRCERRNSGVYRVDRVSVREVRASSPDSSRRRASRIAG